MYMIKVGSMAVFGQSQFEWYRDNNLVYYRLKHFAWDGFWRLWDQNVAL